MSLVVGDPFSLILGEKLAELEAAAQADAQAANDPIEQLRLKAAQLMGSQDARTWATGAARKYQPDGPVPIVMPPTLDIRFPALPAVVVPASEANAAGARRGRGVARQGRRIPQQDTPAK